MGCRQDSRLKPFKNCRHLIVLLRCTADWQNTVSRPKERIPAVPILPHIAYGIAVWGQAAQTNVDKLLILQKRALS